MAETLVENQVCSACGADVREGTLFCYNCGGQVASGEKVSEKIEDEITSDNGFQGKLLKENGTAFRRNKIETTPEIGKVFADKPVANSSLRKETELPTAATMRGKAKNVQPKRIEIIWEERESAPNVWFILVTIALTVFAAVILFLAMRMK